MTGTRGYKGYLGSLYIYPDTLITIIMDSIATDTTLRVQAEYSMIAGNTKLERTVFHFSSQDTTIHLDSGYQFQSIIESKFWTEAYWSWFPARLFFQFQDFLDQCSHAWVSSQVDTATFVISAYKNNSLEPRYDFYIDSSMGRILQIDQLDFGIDRQGTLENMILEVRDIYSDFQSFDGIWLPTSRAEYDFGNPRSNPNETLRDPSLVVDKYSFNLMNN